jgi:nucleoside-diphosphate-sugar epimerase
MSIFLVTGGGGFIGSHLVDRLLQEGHQVRVLDNFSTGRRSNLEHLAGNRSLVVIEGDICEQGVLSKAVRDVQYILHQAAIPSVPRSVQDPWNSHRVNTDGTLKVLMAAKDAGCRRVVFASSSSVYGDIRDGRAETEPKRESLPPAPISPYAATKLAGEAYCRAFSYSYGLETVMLRYFNIFGPRQDPTSQYASVVPRFSEALTEGKRPIIFGDGHQTRDFTYVENAVEANLQACVADGAAGMVFNVACGQSISVLQLLNTMAEVLGVEANPEHVAPRAGDVRHSLADVTKAKELLGYESKVSFVEGIRKTLKTFR